MCIPPRRQAEELNGVEEALGRVFKGAAAPWKIYSKHVMATHQTAELELSVAGRQSWKLKQHKV